MKTVAAIINYESPQFLMRQIVRIKLFMGPTKIIIFDNSPNPNLYNMQSVSEMCGAYYALTPRGNEKDPSRHHAQALNYAYSSLRNIYDIVGLFDHDVFPIAENDIYSRAEEYDFCGLSQIYNEQEYLHPGYLFINTSRVRDELDFMPSPGVDTGGQLSELISRSKVLKFSYELDPWLGHEIIDGKLMHFVKGSNWNGIDKDLYEQRLRALFQKLESITEAKLL